MQEARKLQFADSRYKNPYYWGAYYVTGNETRGIGGELHASKQE